MLVDRFLDESARVHPDRVALVCGTRRVTYRWLDEATNRFARGLRAHGVGPGDRVVVQLDNSVEAVLSLFGTWRAGGVAVPINPTVKAAKLTYILQDCEPVALIADRRAMSEISPALSQAVSVRLLVLADTREDAGGQASVESGTALDFNELLDPAHHESTPPDVAVVDVDLAALVYTSGSTGRPKGVMLTHGNIVAAATSIDAYLQNTPDDVILDVLPLSFDYGLYQALLAFKAGARLVLERSFAYPGAVLDLLVKERVTALPLVPMMAALLVRQDLASFDLSALRYITNTGAVLPPAHIQSLRSSVPHVRIFSMYGLTECKRVSYLSPDQIDSHPTSVGRPMDNVEVYLIDSDGRRTTQGVGELVVRGSNVMQGYWRAPEETARALKPGLLPGEMVLHTGDIFRIDADGLMYFQSRIDDVIKSRGQKVSPREVENVLHAAPGVCEAIVIGVPDPIVGEAVKGYVTLESGARTTAAEILHHCSKHLEDFMVPQSVEIVTELPHNASGKLARKVLQAAGAP